MIGLEIKEYYTNFALYKTDIIKALYVQFIERKTRNYFWSIR